MDALVADRRWHIQHCLGRRGGDRAGLAIFSGQHATTCATRPRDLAMLGNGLGGVWTWIFGGRARATAPLANCICGIVWQSHGSYWICVDRLARNNRVGVWRQHSHQRFDLVDSICIHIDGSAARVACIARLIGCVVDALQVQQSVTL